jgi:hypothetical protein
MLLRDSSFCRVRGFCESLVVSTLSSSSFFGSVFIDLASAFGGSDDLSASLPLPLPLSDPASRSNAPKPEPAEDAAWPKADVVLVKEPKPPFAGSGVVVFRSLVADANADFAPNAEVVPNAVVPGLLGVPNGDVEPNADLAPNVDVAPNAGAAVTAGEPDGVVLAPGPPPNADVVVLPKALVAGLLEKGEDDLSTGVVDPNAPKPEEGLNALGVVCKLLNAEKAALLELDVKGLDDGVVVSLGAKVDFFSSVGLGVDGIEGGVLGAGPGVAGGVSFFSTAGVVPPLRDVPELAKAENPPPPLLLPNADWLNEELGCPNVLAAGLPKADVWPNAVWPNAD